jgi:hypothetical protein
MVWKSSRSALCFDVIRFTAKVYTKQTDFGNKTEICYRRFVELLHRVLHVVKF